MRRLHLIGILLLATFAVTGCQSPANSEAPATAAAADTPPAKPVDQFHEVTIPADTALAAVLDTSVSSASSRVDDPVRAHLARPVSVDGFVALPAGTEISGAVVDAEGSRRVK